MKRILDQVDCLEDLKKLTVNELLLLCKEIREQLLIRLSQTGGHIASNLGMVEVTVALHYVFNSPIDKIVFDVSHQCYTHKLLTGRKEAYTNPSQYQSVSGFTNPKESIHDIFAVGHTSTSVSLACGLVKARDLKHEKYNVIAIIGDGSLSGGEALEGLNNASTLKSNMIIIINDNEMSIAENHGGLYGHLKLLRETNGQADCHFFKALGFDYRFIKDGHNIEELISTFQEVKDINHPVVLHICTVKGKGYSYAQNNKEQWHFQDAFDIETGKSLNTSNENVETYENLTRDYMIKKMTEDPTVVAVTAGTPKIFGFDKKLRQRFADQFVDVGIAEQHAIAFVSGIAKNGGKPVFGVSSSFLQRAYDQLSQDLALNRSPAVILVFFSGISKGSQTHMGIFDMSLTMNIPQITYLTPTCKEEYLDMLEWGLQQTVGPVIIRVPGIVTTKRNVELLNNYHHAKYELVSLGKQVAILAVGSCFTKAVHVQKDLEAILKTNVTLINPRSITHMDYQTLDQLKKDHHYVVTIEDGVIDGGFGEKVVRYYGTSSMKVMNFGARKEFVDHMEIEKQYQRYHMTREWIVRDILTMMKEGEE